MATVGKKGGKIVANTCLLKASGKCDVMDGSYWKKRLWTELVTLRKESFQISVEQHELQPL